MVTHDEYMKQYATRIFNVSDGKIHKVQVCDLNKRDEAIKELKTTVENYDLNIDNQGVKGGVNEDLAEDQKSGEFSETRRIMDYPFIKHLKMRVENENQ